MINIKDIEYIESFFEGKLNKAGIEAFNKRLSTDNEFRQLNDNYKLAQNTIQTYSRQELFNRLESIGRNFTTPVYKKTWFKVAVGIVSVMVLAISLYIFNQNGTADNDNPVNKSVNAVSQDKAGNKTVQPGEKKSPARVPSENQPANAVESIDITPGINTQSQNPAKASAGESNTSAVSTVNNSGQQAGSGIRSLNGKAEVVFYADKFNGCGKLTVHFYDSSGLDNNNIKHIFWNFGDGFTASVQNPVHQYTKPGNYSVRLTITTTDGQEISSIRKNYIRVNPQPLSEFTVVPEKAILSNAKMVFTNLSANAASKTFYKWDFGDHSDISKIKSPTHTYLDTGIYNIVLTVRNEFKCQDQTTKTVIVLEDVKVFIPNIFSPDNSYSTDNRKFKVVATGITEFHMLIFDRNGTLYYESSDYDTHGWDGNTSFGQAPMGSYVYKIKVKGLDGNYYDFKGVISLAR